jgi:hypothetical protein
MPGRLFAITGSGGIRAAVAPTMTEQASIDRTSRRDAWRITGIFRAGTIERVSPSLHERFQNWMTEKVEFGSGFMEDSGERL